MARQLGQGLVRIGAVHRFDGVADGAMKLPPSGNAQFVVQGHADQVVGKLVATRRRLLDDVRRHRLVQRLQQHVFGQRRPGAQQYLPGEVATDHRGKREDLVAAGGQEIEAAADRLGYPLGDSHRRGKRCVTESAPLFEKAYDLAQEQRVALGLDVQRLCQPRWCRCPGGSDECLHLLLAQPREIEPGKMRYPRQAAQRIGQRVVTRQFSRTISADQQNPTFGQLGGEKLEQTQGRRVGPMEIVEHDQQSAAAAQAREQPPDRFEHAKAGLGRVAERGRPLQPRQQIADLRHDIGNIARRGAQTGKNIAIGVTQQSTDDLHPRPIGRRSGLLMATAPQHRHLAPCGTARELLCRAGLADAGLTSEHDHAPPTRTGLLECTLQQLQLALPPDEFIRRRGG